MGVWLGRGEWLCDPDVPEFPAERCPCLTSSDILGVPPCDTLGMGLFFWVWHCVFWVGYAEGHQSYPAVARGHHSVPGVEPGCPLTFVKSSYATKKPLVRGKVTFLWCLYLALHSEIVKTFTLYFSDYSTSHLTVTSDIK